MKGHGAELAIAAVVAAFCLLLAIGDALPDHLTPSAAPLEPATAAQRFPDTAEVLQRALPQVPEPAAPRG